MARKRMVGFTDREVEILAVLWEHGEATVEDIRQQLSGEPTVSTVRTLLNVMVDREYIGDNGKEYGRTYHAKVSKAEGQRSVLRNMIDTVFAGSPEALVLRLLETEKLDWDRVKKLRKRLKDMDR